MHDEGEVDADQQSESNAEDDQQVFPDHVLIPYYSLTVNPILQILVFDWENSASSQDIFSL